MYKDLDRGLALFLLLANGILVDTEAVTGEFCGDVVLQRIRGLTGGWRDSASLLEPSLTLIAEKQGRIDLKRSSTYAVRHIIPDTRRLRQGDGLSVRFSLIHASSHWLKRGVGPLDVIESVLD